MRDFLFIHDYPPTSGGGIEVNTYNLSRELVSRGFKVTILTSRATSETYKDSKTSVLDNPRIVVTKLPHIIRAEINQHKKIVVMCTFSLRSAMMSALKILNKANRPYYAYIRTHISHLGFSRLSRINSEVASETLSEFKDCLSNPNCKIIGVSKSSIKSIKRLGLCKKVSVIHPGIDWNELKLKKSKPIFDLCYIGEVASNKGVHMIPYSIVLLKKKFPNIKTAIIGEGDERISLTSLCKLLQIDKNVTFTGYQERPMIQKYLNSSKILVHPSLSESWSNVVVEALGLAKEVVVSYSEGLKESSKLSPYSYTFKPGDIEGMTKYINQAMKNYSRRRVKRFVAAKEIRDKISTAEQTNQIIRITKTVDKIYNLNHNILLSTSLGN